MEEIIKEMKKLGFSSTESEIYLILLKSGSMTGYQIAKQMTVSRASVYSALDNLYQRGVVSMISGDPNMYQAWEPDKLFDKMKTDFAKTTDGLKKQLAEFNKSNRNNKYFNIEGRENIISKAKYIFNSSKKEIYINTDFNLHEFKDEIISAAARGVRIVVFSFDKLDIEGLPVEMHYYSIESSGECNDIRLMMAADFKVGLIANTENKSDYFGLFTENRLLVSVVAEHIHHDIYLLNLNKKYGENLITKDILINTLLENRDERAKFLKEEGIFEVL